MKNKIYWCDSCKIPISLSEEAIPKICTLCSADLKYLSSDIRPVFPEERLLLEIIIAELFEFIEKSVWCNNSMYFIDGKNIQ